MKRSTFTLLAVTIVVVAFFRLRAMKPVQFSPPINLPAQLVKQDPIQISSSHPFHPPESSQHHSLPIPIKKEPLKKEPVQKEPVQKEPVQKEPVQKEPVHKMSNEPLPARILSISRAKMVQVGSSPRGFALRRRGDSALNYMKRKDALVKQGFSVQLLVFASWSLCNINLESRQRSGKAKFVDVLVCLSKSYCLNDRVYSLTHTHGILTDRILGQREFWSNKRGLCNTLRGNLKANTREGQMWLNSFSFDCFVLPNHAPQLSAVVSLPWEERTGWVFKPDNSGGGSGIFVKDGKEALMKFFQRNPTLKRTFVVQRKLAEPYLINGKKFDLRTHVLVTSVAPMRAYVHKNGLVRFAGTSYSSSTDNNRTSFLTNLSVNNKGKNHEELSWTFHELRNHLGDEAALVFRRIDKAIAELLVSTEKSFLRRYSQESLPKTFSCSNCYQQIGIDILIDKDLKPHIMEINGNPMQNFKSDKISAVCVKFQSDITRLLYGTVNTTKAIASRLETMLRELSPNGKLEEWKWLQDNSVEYLLRMLAEHENNQGFRVVYPPSGAVVSKAERVEWTELLRHLGADSQRKQLHELLMLYQKQRLANCRDYHVGCSPEVDDVLFESPYTVFKAAFPS